MYIATKNHWLHELYTQCLHNVSLETLSTDGEHGKVNYSKQLSRLSDTSFDTVEEIYILNVPATILRARRLNHNVKGPNAIWYSFEAVKMLVTRSP